MSDLLTVLQGDALAVLRTLPDESVQCCATSPPYFGLRSYLPEDHRDKALEVGIEQSPDAYVSNLVAVFSEVRRVLRLDGSLWLNLGDSFNGSGRKEVQRNSPKQMTNRGATSQHGTRVAGLKPKDLVGIPWMVAFALRADGWYLRQWIPWVKRNSMPESVDDRPASSCELVFLLTKNPDCYYDYDAVKLPASFAFQNDGRWKTGSTPENEKNGYAESKAQNPKSVHRMFDKRRATADGALFKDPRGFEGKNQQRRSDKQRGHSRRHAGFNDRWDQMEKEQQYSGWRATRNSDWFFEGLLSNDLGEPMAFVGSPANYPEAHFATWPEWLVRPMILAGAPAGGTVLDPFAGSGTTGKVALELGRKAVLIELNPAYVELIHQRTNVTPGFSNLTFEPPVGTDAAPGPPQNNQ